MTIRIHELAVPYDRDSLDELRRALEWRMGSEFKAVKTFEVVRRSIDARQRPIKIRYSVDVEVNHFVDCSAIQRAADAPKPEPVEVRMGGKKLDNPPVVIGGGPAGLFAALLLAEHGFAPVLFERGGRVRSRIEENRRFFSNREVNPECNVLFGLGGAGTFSDGKLTTGLRHRWLYWVLNILVECGAPKDIQISAKPHIGTDLLVDVVEKLAKRIEKAGGTVHTDSKVEELICESGALKGIRAIESRIDAEVAVLAIGHSARDTMAMISGIGVEIAPKPFQIGVRVEHPQEWVDRVRYGKAAGHEALGAADYKLTAKIGNVPVFSFCMCPGGWTIPTVSEPGYLALNGMSLRARDSRFAGSGIVVTLRPEDYGGSDLASCLAFQRGVEKACFEAGGKDYLAPSQRLVDFALGKPNLGPLPSSSYRPGIKPALLGDILPCQIANPIRESLVKFERSLSGYLHPEAVVLAPESRASSPIRIIRDAETMESVSIAGIYPVGEGAGYAGGIMSSALDGLDAAKRIIETHTPPKVD